MKDTNQSSTKSSENYMVGWMCPKCGAVMSPWQATCPHCTPTSPLKITYAPNVTPYYPGPYWLNGPTCISLQTSKEGGPHVQAFSC